ncbi:MAG: mechanosensitive ion channel domain-containing protein, partial [Candidatus Omnitrophota bacterium]
PSKAIIHILFFLCYFSLYSQTLSQEQLFPQNQDGLGKSLPSTVETIKEQTQEIKVEAEAAKKEVEFHKKKVELEKKQAEVKLKEAQAAKEEVEVIKETAGNSREVREVRALAVQKEKEAKQAFEKVKLSEEKMLAAIAKSEIAAEELRLALQRAETAEGKIKEKQNITYKKILQTAIVIIIGYCFIFILVGVINRRIKEIKAKHIIRKNIIYVLTFLIIIYIVFIWVRDINSITIFLSIIGAGLALALQEVILCVAGWFLILLRRPFEVGDRIELGGVKGDVIDIRLFQTSLLEIGNWVEADQSTGRIVNIPNSAIFKKENYNYNRGFEFVWNEIKIIVTFESDIKRAEEIMLGHAMKIAEGMDEIVRREINMMSRRYMIHYEKFTPIVYADIKDSGVELSLRYLTEARKRRFTQDKICRAVLADFDKEEKVNFAYTTYRIVK